MAYQPSKYGFDIDTNNSTTIPLVPSGTYIGTSTDVSNYSQIHVNCFFRPNEIPSGDPTTAKGSMFVEFSPDDTNWDTSIPIVVRNGIFIPQTYIVVLPYFRIRYLNDGGAAAISALNTGETSGTPLLQTEFRLTSILLHSGTKELGRTLDQSISGSDPIALNRSVISALKLDGLMEPTNEYANVFKTQRGGLEVSPAWSTIYQAKTPDDPALPSGTLPLIDLVLNAEANVLDSGWIPVKEFGGGQFLHIKSNTELTVYLLNASDELGNNLQGNLAPVFVTGAGFPKSIGAPFFDDYFRIIVINDSGSSATEYTIRSQGAYTAPPPFYATLDTQLADFFPAPIYRSVLTGRQPDGDYVNSPADGEAFSTTTLLGAGIEYISPWVDTDGWNDIQIFIRSDQISDDLGIILEFTDDIQATPSPTVQAAIEYTFTQADIDRGYLELNASPRLDGFRLRYNNGPTAVGLFYISATLRVNSTVDKHNDSGALIISNYGAEVAYDNMPNVKSYQINGRQPDTDPGQIEDVWAASGDYTGQPEGYTPSTITITSSSANDTDLTGTGARKIEVTVLEDTTSTEYTKHILNMNGVIGVTSLFNVWRLIKAEVTDVGSNDSNTGTITITGNGAGTPIFASMPSGYNQTQICAFTVPANRKIRIVRDSIKIVRSNGSAGSATVQVLARKPGQAFTGPAFEVQTGGEAGYGYFSGRVFPAGTDLKMRILDVSDTNTVTNGFFELEETNA